MSLVHDRFASVGVTVAALERRSPENFAQFNPRRARKMGGSNCGERCDRETLWNCDLVLIDQVGRSRAVI